MICQYKQNGNCTLNRYGGMPSDGVCYGCMDRNENNPEFVSSHPEPSLVDKVKYFSSSMAIWAKTGFKSATQEQLETRMETCKGCEFWDASGFGGTGSCKKCGCSTQAKLRMDTSKCPIDKWGPIEVVKTD